jgi:hypothetical protein
VTCDQDLERLPECDQIERAVDTRQARQVVRIALAELGEEPESLLGWGEAGDLLEADELEEAGLVRACCFEEVIVER